MLCRIVQDSWLLLFFWQRPLFAALKTRLQEENVYLQEEIRGTHQFEEIVGQSAALRRVLVALG